MYDAIEGVDYIFDRYAYLGLEQGADRKAIEQVIRQKRAGLHPDRMVNVDADIVRQAERKRDLINQCADILLNDDLRPLYDERLNQFKTEKPQFVSESGSAIIDIYAERFSLESLLSQEIPDTSYLEQEIARMTQFDEKKFAEVKSLYQMMSANEQIRKIYKDALTMKLVYLELLEDTAWAKIGYSKKNKKTDGHAHFADEYVAKVESELKRVAGAVIDEAVQQRNDAMRIGFTAPLLLEDKSAGAKPGAPAVLNDEMQAKIKAKARENFEIRADYVRDVAKKKQEVLEELVGLAETRDLSPRDPEDPVYEVYLAMPTEKTTIVAKFNLVASQAYTNLDPEFKGGMALADLENNVRKTNSIVVIRNNEITDAFMEVTALCNKICNEWEAAHKPAAPAP